MPLSANVLPWRAIMLDFITPKTVLLAFIAIAAVAAVVIVYLGERLQNLSDDIDDMGGW